MRHLTLLLFLATATALLLAGAGCSDSDSDNNTGTAPLTGTGGMQVFLIDAPGDYEQVNVQVIEVSVHADGEDSISGWHTIAVDTTEVNLLELTDGNYAVLADSTLPAGQYSQVRLLLGEGNNVVVDGEVHELTVPSGSQTGLKLNHPFTIEDGMTYAVTLDFDAERSVLRTGNGTYKLKPVIRLIVNEHGGSLHGVVEPVAARAFVMTVAGQDTLYAHADTVTGAYRFAMLPVGSYDLQISATEGAYLDSTLAGVAVQAGVDTDMGTVVLQEP